MLKKAMLSFLILCMLMNMVGCGGNPIIPPVDEEGNIHITDMFWVPDDKVIEITLNQFPSTWGDWTMYINGEKLSMEEGTGKPVVAPNADLDEPPTGLYVGTLPWLSPLTEVDFPCCGTIQFDIPGEGLTNEYEFNLINFGCETASEEECSTEIIDSDLVEEEDFNVIIDEGGVFEFTDGAKVEIGENALSKNATLTISKLVLPTEKQASSDFEILSSLYDIRFNEQDVQIIKPIKISLPIPPDVNLSEIAVAHFHEGDQFDILNGVISPDGKFISIEVSELSLFGIIDFLTSGEIEELPFIDTLMDLYINLIVSTANSDYDTLQAMTIFWEYKLKEAEDAIINGSGGITVGDVGYIGFAITMGIGTSFISGPCMAYLAASGVSKTLLAAMGFGVKISGILKQIKNLLDYTNWDDIAVEVTEYITAYIMYNSYLNAYQTIGLEGWADVTPIDGPAPLKVHLNGAVSGGTKPYTYQWDFGDDNWSEKIPDTESFWLYHTYEETGQYRPILYAEDAEGKTGRFVAEEVTVTDSDIDGDITNVSPLTEPFTLYLLYTTNVYVQNTGRIEHTFTVKALESLGTDFEVNQKTITLSPGSSGSVSFKYQFGMTPCNTLTFELYDESSNLLDSYEKTLCIGVVNHPPVISDLSADPPSVDINQTTTITCIASDQDDDPLTYDWTVNAGSFEGDTSGPSVTWRAPSSTDIYIVVGCEVSDGEGGEDNDSVNIIVTESEEDDSNDEVIFDINYNPIEIYHTITVTCDPVNQLSDNLTWTWEAPYFWNDWITTDEHDFIIWTVPGYECTVTIYCTIDDGINEYSGSLEVEVVNTHEDDTEEIISVIQEFELAMNNLNWEKAKSCCVYESSLYDWVLSWEHYIYPELHFIPDFNVGAISIENIGLIQYDPMFFYDDGLIAYVFFTEGGIIDGETITAYKAKKISNAWKIGTWGEPL